MQLSDARARLVLGIVTFSIGATLALLPTRLLMSPEWNSAPSADASITVPYEQYQDDRLVQVTFQESEPREVKAPADGVIRITNCSTAETMKSGTAPYLINDRPIVALNLESPPWRDLAPGVQGTDVTALQKELQRLGFLTSEPDGTYGAQTGEAVAKLWASVGGGARNTLPLTSLLWLPTAAVLPTGCTAQLGDVVSVGDPLFTAGGEISSMTVQLPDGLLSGERSAAIGSIETPLPADATITDPVFLQAFSQSPRYETYKKDPTTPLAVNLRLNEPIEVAVLPAAALYQIEGDLACVASGDTGVSVKILASQLGNTYVLPAVTLETVFVNPPDNAPACK